MDPWTEAWIRFLCELMKLYGRTCEELGINPTRASQIVLEEFNANGPPPMPSDVTGYLKMLGKMRQHLASPDNPLSPALTQELNAMITALQNAAGANP